MKALWEWLRLGVTRTGFTWEAEDGSEGHTHPWDRAEWWALRPKILNPDRWRWTMRDLPCGCRARRLTGSVRWYDADCRIHWQGL